MNDEKNRHSYYIIYKPYCVLSQFTGEEGKKTLGDLYPFPKDVYPIGRLDADSEGLLLLTNDTVLNYKLLHPSFKHQRSYLVQVEGAVTASALIPLTKGINIKAGDKNYFTLPAKAELVDEPQNLPIRTPPVRFRKNIPTSWIKLTLTEGKNRQVRKMTAAIGYPTLRLIRLSIESLKLGDMQPGQVIKKSRHEIYANLKLLA